MKWGLAAVVFFVAGCAAHHGPRTALSRCWAKTDGTGVFVYDCPGAVTAVMINVPRPHAKTALADGAEVFRRLVPAVVTAPQTYAHGGESFPGLHLFARDSDHYPWTGDAFVVPTDFGARFVLCGGSYSGVSPTSCREIFEDLLALPLPPVVPTESSPT